MNEGALAIKTAIDSLESRIQLELQAIGQKAVDGEKANAEQIGELKALLKDWDGAMKDIQGLKSDMVDLMQSANDDQTTQGKSVGLQLVESENFKNFRDGLTNKCRFETKNTIVTGGDNSVTPYDKLPGVIEGAFRMLTVMPTIEQYNATSNIVYYSRELAWTNNAAGQTEGAPKAESDLTFEEVNKAIQTVAHFLKVSKQALDDSEFLASYIDRRLRHGVNNKLEDQIINGDGLGNNFSGWLAAGNSTATSPTGTTDIYGLTNKMKYEVISADYMPDFYYFNPQDWSTMETTRRGASDGAFIGASGAVSYVNNGLTPLLWGLPVVVSNNIPQGTVVCKSRDADAYANRSSTVVEMFEQDDTNVQSNLITVRGEARGAALNFRPTAIRTGDIGSIT